MALRCCAALRGLTCAPGACDAVTRKQTCEATHAADLSALCVWAGGQCTQAQSLHECKEPYDDADYYGERRAFEKHCGDGDGAHRKCAGYGDAYRKYAQRHARATVKVEPPGGTSKARVLVIRDHWRNVGMGFMPYHVSDVLHFALQTGIFVYFENYGRYDWQRYFYGYGGLDARWTSVRRRLWTRRFAADGVSRPRTIEVLHEDGSHRGDEDWELNLTAALRDPAERWILIEGQATTVTWSRVLKPALAALGARGALESAFVRADESNDCAHCTYWASFRPRRVLREPLAASPVGRGEPLVCLKARTMYAEDKAYFPDTLEGGLAGTDWLWKSYKGKMGDDTNYWGARPRLRCTPSHGVARANKAPPSLVLPSDAIQCLLSVRQKISHRARIFVAVDAPRLQTIALEALGPVGFTTPGVGVDPTNEYRDEDKARPRYAGQVAGKQDLAEQNLVKVSLDFFIQGFCVSALTLRPSAFYSAASKRTERLRTELAANATADARGQGGCVAEPQEPHFDSLTFCQAEVCGLRSCNLLQ